jgi:hypothetical protein
MTAVNENGQLYFTFEELDFEGALWDVVSEINSLQDFLDTVNSSHPLYSSIDKKVVSLQTTAIYLERLKWGYEYV